MHSELSLLQLKAGEVEEADSLYFLPAETDGGEGEVEMMETHRDKSKKKKKGKKWEQGGMLCRQASAWGREMEGDKSRTPTERDGLCNPAGNKGGYGFV